MLATQRELHIAWGTADMNDIVNDEEKGRAWLDAEKVQISDAQVAEFEDGSLRELGDGEQFSDEFWADAVQTTLYQTHPRVPALKTELVCQYKFENGRIHVKTLRYKMTTRYGNWYRANIDLGLQAGTWVRKNSPDSMRQDTQWHEQRRVRSSTCTSRQAQWRHLMFSSICAVASRSVYRWASPTPA